ncbi:MAG: uracil-DNA glycosylase, partial [Pseudomonadota bacterium]
LSVGPVSCSTACWPPSIWVAQMPRHPYTSRTCCHGVRLKTAVLVPARRLTHNHHTGRDEDREGRPFVGRAGQLLDRMLAAIDMGRADAEAPVYITNVLPWRPPQNRDPRPEEIAMMKPFLERHIALISPQALVVMGNISCQALLGKKGITRLRGTWTEAHGVPALPMFHPAYLLRNPSAKRETWADLLTLKARLRDG